MILGTSRALRVFAHPEAVDLRKRYDGLFGLVKRGLGGDPLLVDLFLFVNLRRKGCKVFALGRHRSLHLPEAPRAGRFASPWRETGEVVRMTASELALFIEGCAIGGSPSALARAGRACPGRTLKERCARHRQQRDGTYCACR
jgi:hypothetical protein